MNKKKSIILILILVLIIGIIIVGLNNKKETNNNISNEVNESNGITKEEMTKIANKTVKEKLGQEGLILEEKGLEQNKNINSRGTVYKVYIDEDRTKSYEIQVHIIDIKIIKKIKKDMQEGEITIEGEKYWKNKSTLIKLSENDTINNIIKKVIV